MASNTAPATYKQPSRKGKKAWRKNVDITEVQSGLDELRTDIIQGGPVSEKPADELFLTDVAGDVELEKTQRKQKKLRVDEILAQRDSKVEALQPGRKRKVEDHSGSGVGGKRVKGNGEYVSHRELRRLRNVADGAGIGVLAEEQASNDLWGAPDAAPPEEYSFLEKKKDKVAPKSLKQAPKPLTANGKAVAAVLKPNAGKSYNPLLNDWSALLEKEGQAAVDAEKARLAAEAEQAERERKAEEEAAKVEALEKEEYATDYESAWESEWDGIQSEAEQEIYTQKQKGRKTPAERNKAKAKKEREAREKWEKKQKERDVQEKRIKEIAKQVSANDKEKKLAKRDVDISSESDEDEASQLAKRRFGKLSVPEAPVEVTLPEDLNDSLRRLKPEGSLLTDRYRNLLINGKLEVRKKVGQAKKPQRQRTEKWTYKDFKLK
ncbi:uncharacterized protein MYCFIDRAFT_157129 [Pseudocercospora fijiensis CIRAD86]|uniref:Ribosome biogenesis protein NOP53 n=1 Tax=Pseudocercospora fijiensis (strain CIRAD86) TaxID=383855 RepID=M2YKQ3_PSEFD|nr:uncharacterized protein MYCFIDRAFT_157129 [Pseudocercospora fijiensis CIRAD86]EME78300.1 hypothetical protein MYCFIDRAFT_157129 [Pseudocercospora fijiensis CIRAD86]